MDEPAVYEIRLKGQLSGRWSDWFEGFSIQPGPGGTTTLRGRLPDQSALLGLLNKLHALNLTLLSVVDCGAEELI